MALNWGSVRAEHVLQACAALRAEQKQRSKEPRLYVRFEGAELPAKEVLGRAYRIANDLPTQASLRFSSGEGTLSRLRALGFEAGRRTSADTGEQA